MDTAEEQSCKPPYINHFNHDPRSSTHTPAPQPTESAILYGNPYYSLLNPIDHTRTFREWAGSGSRSGLVTFPEFVDAKSGNIIVSERGNHRLQIFDNVGDRSRFDRFGCQGFGPNQFDNPGGVTTTNEHFAKIVVADTGNRRVCLFRVKPDSGGYGLIDLNFYFGHQLFQAPTGVEWDHRRNMLIVVDQMTKRVSQHDMRTGQCCGEFRPPAAIPLIYPTDIAIDDNGLCYVSDGYGRGIHVYERNGDFICRFGGEPGSGEGQFNKPFGLCFDRSNNLLIADEGNSRIVMYRARDGARTNCAFERIVTTEVYAPKGISINAHENLVVCDANMHDYLKIFKYK